MPEEIVMRHRSPHFGHVFTSDPHEMHSIRFESASTSSEILSYLETIDVRQREIQDHLYGGECLPRPLTQSMQDIEYELQMLKSLLT